MFYLIEFFKSLGESLAKGFSFFFISCAKTRHFSNYPDFLCHSNLTTVVVVGVAANLSVALFVGVDDVINDVIAALRSPAARRSGRFS